MCHWRLFFLAGMALLAACDDDGEKNQQEVDTGEETPDTRTRFGAQVAPPAWRSPTSPSS